MIEGALVYLLTASRPNAFVGCGAVIEGELIATCRHVWHDAIAKAPEGALPLVEFPRAATDARRYDLTLADACEDEEPIPDLVLLRPAAIPPGTPVLQLAMKEMYQTGDAAGRARVRRDTGGWIEVTVQGQLDSALGPDGRRQFTGETRQGYWFVRGSSGSPLFRRGAQQLAGLLSLSELGANEDKSPLQEAFVVPATTIRRFRERLAARPIAAAEHIERAALRSVLDAIGAADIPVQEIPARLQAFVEEARARAEEPVSVTSAGGDVDATIGAARDRLRRYDVAGARELLAAKLAEERAARAVRILPLLREEAAMARLSFDHGKLCSALAEIADLTPDEPTSWIKLGDAWETAGNTAEALRAYRRGEDAARRSGNDYDLSVTHDKVGDVQQAQGDLAAALTSYQASLAIAERLTKADPDNAGWQRDLSVSYDNVGDVQQAQGDLATALTSYQASLAIRERLAKADPGNAGWQRDLSVSYNKVGDVQQAQGDLATALTSYQASLAIRERLAKADPGNADWQRDLSVSYNKVGAVQQAQGDLATALTSYQASLAIRERLAKADPGNAGWQRDLSVSYKRIGAVQRAQGDLTALTSYQVSLAIAERLAKADPGNAGWQRDLSVSYDNVGDVQQAQGDLATALTSYQASLAIRERLAKADPGNADWQRDLSVSYNAIGDVQQAQGDLAAALTSYQASLAIRERLAKADPGNAGWQRDLSVSYDNVGDAVQAVARQSINSNSMDSCAMVSDTTPSLACGQMKRPRSSFLA